MSKAPAAYAPQYVPVHQVAPHQNIQNANQFGRPIQSHIQQQQPHVQYVNQYGQPIQTYVANTQPNIQYSNQYGPVQTGTALGPGVISVPTPWPTAVEPNSPEKEKQQRTIAFAVGGLGGFLLLIGLFTNSLAVWSFFDYSIHCGWVGVHDSYESHSYSEINDASTDNPAANAQTAAAICCILMVTACLVSFIGTILVQPFCQVQRCCQTNSKRGSCPRSCYLISAILCMSTIGMWYVIEDGYCTNYTSMGSSLVLCIIGMILCGIAGVVAR